MGSSVCFAIQIFTFAVSVGTMIAGIFGMNLRNGHELDEWAFHWTSGSICAVSSLIGVFMFVITTRFL